MGKAWSGRFKERTHPAVEQFTESISFDWKLFEEDIDGSIAHARMLAEVGIISQSELNKIVNALEEIRTEIRERKFKFSPQLEDIHTNIESALIKKIGDAGAKLHTTRSRNDQIALDLKLWTRRRAEELIASIRSLQRAFLDKAEENIELIMPALTHLQPAQPVLVSHYLLAFIEMFDRDACGLRSLLQHSDTSPLGAGACAGTALPSDRNSTAKALGFSRPARNSLDAVSDRDFLCEFLFWLSMVAVHLSRLAEDWTIFASERFRFIELPDSLCTGSSLMPQKKNPDTLELIRSRCARVISSLNRLLIILKGLPLAYCRDLQEDKEGTFDAFETVRDSLSIAELAVRGAVFSETALRSACEKGYLDATALAEYLVRLGIPFRTAHHTVGRIVAHCLSKGKSLEDLTLEEFRKFHEGIAEDVYGILGAENVVNSYCSEGSSSPREVRKQLARWKRILPQQRT